MYIHAEGQLTAFRNAVTEPSKELLYVYCVSHLFVLSIFKPIVLPCACFEC